MKMEVCSALLGLVQYTTSCILHEVVYSSADPRDVESGRSSESGAGVCGVYGSHGTRACFELIDESRTQ